MKTALKLGLIGTFILVGLGNWVRQKQQTAHLRETIADLRQSAPYAAAALAHGNEMVTQPPPGTKHPVRQEVEEIRTEIASVETTSALAIASTLPGGEPFTENRDPEKGPVRIEHFHNVGQATPAATFQTLIWALVNDESDALTTLLGISPAGREKLQTIIARIPSEKQAQFHPPEKVVGMLIALDFLDKDGFQIGEASQPDASGQVILNVLGARSGSSNLLNKRLPFQRAAVGWQLPITDQMIDSLPAKIEQASMYVPPRPGRN